MRRKALLAASAHLERHGPLGKRRVAAFHDRFGLDGEILAAFFLAAAIAPSFLGRVMLQTAAIRADRTIRPAGGFKPPPGGIFIVEMGVCELVLGHDFAPMAKTLALGACGVNYVIGTKFLAHLFRRGVPPLFTPVHPAREPENGYAHAHGDDWSQQQGNRKAAHSRNLPSMRLP